jgi:hypothetical protein
MLFKRKEFYGLLSDRTAPFRRTFENGFLETDWEVPEDVLLKVGDGTAKWFFGVTPTVARQVAAAFSALADWQEAQTEKEAQKGEH